MGDILAWVNAVLFDGVPFAEESVVGDHVPTGPSIFVFGDHVSDDAGVVDNVIVSGCSDLSEVSVAGKENAVGAAYRELVAHYKYFVGLATYTHPARTLHLGEDGLLELHPGVVEALGSEPPVSWVPVEDEAVFLVVAIISE